MNFKIRKYQFVDMNGNKFTLDNLRLIDNLLYFNVSLNYSTTITRRQCLSWASSQ